MRLDTKLYDKLSAYCAYSERCTKDVLEKCKKLEIETDEIPAYIAKLEQQSFLDDFRYTKSFIESKVKRKWGVNKIKAALQKKGIKSTIFEPFLEDIEAETLTANMQALVERKSRTIKADTEMERKQKLIRFLMSKGYSYDLIKNVV